MIKNSAFENVIHKMLAILSVGNVLNNTPGINEGDLRSLQYTSQPISLRKQGITLMFPQAIDVNIEAPVVGK